MSDWPSTLPQLPLANSFSLQPGNNIIESTVDVGPSKRRARGTVAPNKLSMTYHMTPAQLTDFETFFYTTTNYGLDSFNIPYPTTGTLTAVHFVPSSMPVITPVSSEWTVTITVEVDP